MAVLAFSRVFNGGRIRSFIYKEEQKRCVGQLWYSCMWMFMAVDLEKVGGGAVVNFNHPNKLTVTVTITVLISSKSEIREMFILVRGTDTQSSNRWQSSFLELCSFRNPSFCLCIIVSNFSSHGFYCFYNSHFNFLFFKRIIHKIITELPHKGINSTVISYIHAYMHIYIRVLTYIHYTTKMYPS